MVHWAAAPLHQITANPLPPFPSCIEHVGQAGPRFGLAPGQEPRPEREARERPFSLIRQTGNSSERSPPPWLPVWLARLCGCRFVTLAVLRVVPGQCIRLAACSLCLGARHATPRRAPRRHVWAWRAWRAGFGPSFSYVTSIRWSAVRLGCGGRGGASNNRAAAPSCMLHRLTALWEESVGPFSGAPPKNKKRIRCAPKQQCTTVN